MKIIKGNIWNYHKLPDESIPYNQRFIQSPACVTTNMMTKKMVV